MTNLTTRIKEAEERFDKEFFELEEEYPNLYKKIRQLFSQELHSLAEDMAKENIKLFINEYKTKYNDKTLSYYAGVICQDGIITNQQRGAEETFAIGMPVYDEDGNELGKLSIGLFENLDYHAPGLDIKIPVYTWKVDGYKSDVRKKIKTYYQRNQTTLRNLS